MPQPTKPQLAVYAALAIAVLLIGARFLRSGEGGGSAAGGLGAPPAPLADGGGLGAPDGASGAAGAAGGTGGDASGAAEAGGAAATDSAAAVGGTDDVAVGADGGATGASGSSCDAAAGTCAGVVVDVKGAVRRPGVYRLEGDARALDAVRRAGGLSGSADRRGVNLAARVADGDEVIVPRKGERVAAGGGAAGAGAGAAAGGGTAAGAAAAGEETDPATPLEIDLNTATEQELEQLDGVGPATAAKIVAFREQNGGIESVDELDEVSGIGEAKLAAIHAQLGR